jgi:outer membrane protein assembly factor BamB
MVHVRIGEGWASDPGVRAALRTRATSSRRAAIRSIVDVLALEVDGVDIAAGRTEGPLVESVMALVAAVDRLAAGASHASVPFEDGSVELVLHRRGGLALASVVTLSRPARVLAHDVEVDLPRLAEAVREAARSFCARVAEVAPAAAGDSPEFQRLLRVASRRISLAEPPGSGLPTTRSRRTRKRRSEPACGFEIHDEAGRLSTGSRPGAEADLASLLVRGRVTLRSGGGTEILSLDGTPFLLFRDLCEGAARLAGAHGGTVTFALARPGRRATATVAVDGSSVSVDGGRPTACDPLALAHAIVDGALDFCAVVKARAPVQARNALLAELESSARSALAEIREARAGDRPAGVGRRVRLAPSPRVPGHPLAPGRLRKVSLRRMASADVGTPASEGLFRSGRVIVACGAEKSHAFDARSGASLWAGPGAPCAALAGGTFVTLREGRLLARDAGSGAPLWERATPGTPATRVTISTGPAGRILLGSGSSTAAIEASTGSVDWTFRSPGALRLHPLPLGDLTVLAADSGMIHAIDAAGDLAWRLRGAGTLAVNPVQDGRGCLLCFRTPTGATLASVDASSGVRVFEASLDFTPAGAPIRVAGRIAIAGRVGGDGVVAAIEADGSPAWVVPSPFGATLALASMHGALLVKGPDGSCAALDREGRTIWSRSCDGGTAPPGNLRPVPVRGLLVVPAEEVDLLDATTGEVVGRVPIQGPARLSVYGDLATWALDADGQLTAARLRGHLSVVDGSAAR